MSAELAANITNSASRQTFLTIRYLADPPRQEDAYRCYAYFRWVDDRLDGQSNSPTARAVFLRRQQDLLRDCYTAHPREDTLPQEQILVDLVRNNPDKDCGLYIYLQNMMKVMEFDASRRGRLITGEELEQYTHLLASAVTEAMHYFIGHGKRCPQDASRYMAVSGAHITHMLRDTVADVRSGYFNIPLEVLDSHHISPYDLTSPAFTAWVEERVRQARHCFKVGKSYLHRVANLRCRLAGFAYAIRFERLLDRIEREGFRLRPDYEEGKPFQMYWSALTASLGWNREYRYSHSINFSPLERS